jgi:hypothetical protein
MKLDFLSFKFINGIIHFLVISIVLSYKIPEKLLSTHLALQAVLRIREDFIPDPAEFHSGSRILSKRKKGSFLKLLPELFL